MAEVIRRPGFKVIAEIPAGATIKRIQYGDEPAWVVAHPESPPYILTINGEKLEINPDFTELPP